MNAFEHLHEVEEVEFHESMPKSCQELWHILSDLGFTQEEDVFWFQRNVEHPIWQSDSYASIYVSCDDEEIYDESSQWDLVRVKYLLASLPTECISVFVTKCTQISNRLKLPMQFRGRVVTPELLSETLTSYAEELKVTLAEPGSEALAIYIESTYPRNRQ